jgi:hypothetical protein
MTRPPTSGGRHLSVEGALGRVLAVVFAAMRDGTRADRLSRVGSQPVL